MDNLQETQEDIKKKYLDSLKNSNDTNEIDIGEKLNLSPELTRNILYELVKEGKIELDVFGLFCNYRIKNNCSPVDILMEEKNISRAQAILLTIKEEYPSFEVGELSKIETIIHEISLGKMKIEGPGRFPYRFSEIVNLDNKDIIHIVLQLFYDEQHEIDTN